MPTMTMPAPTAVTVNDDVMHLICCDDDVAQCGLDVTDHAWVTTGIPCPLCAHITDAGLPCPVPGCSYA